MKNGSPNPREDIDVAELIAAPTVNANLRRAPVQARSADRVQLLLDTTAELLEEVGVDRVTTGMVAERADVSIGSVYRFFPDRLALLRALSRRNLERFVDRISDVLSDQSGDYEDWWQALEMVIDRFVEMHETEPGFRVLRFGDIIDERLIDERTSSNSLLAAALKSIVVERYGGTDGEDLMRHMEAATEICDAMLSRAFLEDPKGDAWFIEECKRIVRGYLDETVSFA